MPIMDGTKKFKHWEGYYDFAVDAGATGTIVLRSNDGPLPAGAIVRGGYVDVTTACASATGTMALQAEAANDVVNAVGQASWTLGVKSVIPAFTGATAVKTTAARNPSLVIGTAVFTAGKFKLVLNWS